MSAEISRSTGEYLIKEYNGISVSKVKNVCLFCIRGMYTNNGRIKSKRDLFRLFNPLFSLSATIKYESLTRFCCTFANINYVPGG